MNIQFIDITSYRGISINAEHYYAKVSREDYNADVLAMNFGWRLEDCSDDPSGKELRYYPDEVAAKEYSEKDFPDDKEMQDHNTHIMVQEGTVRFPSVIEILKAARKEYPDAVLYVTYRGSHKEFLHKFIYDGNSNFPIKEIVELLVPKKQD